MMILCRIGILLSMLLSIVCNAMENDHAILSTELAHLQLTKQNNATKEIALPNEKIIGLPKNTLAKVPGMLGTVALCNVAFTATTAAHEVGHAVPYVLFGKQKV